MTKTTGGAGRRAGNVQAGKAIPAGLAGLAVGMQGGPGGDLVAGREYLRVSDDSSGRFRSPEEQHADNVAEAARVGISLGAPYRDDNRSASRFKSKEREDFDRLVTDLENDAFGARVLLLWESSRGSREVGEWVYLIELCERRGVQIHVTTHHRTYDPANGRDRRSLIEDATDSEYESWKISQRALRATAANAEAGKPHGRTPYGYRRRYDEVTRKFVIQEPDVKEAPVVRALFRRLEARHSLREIADYFARKGWVTRSGKAWTPEHLRSVALRRAYIGERVYDPSRRGGTRDTPDAQYIKGQWKPLISRDRFFAVQDILDDKSRKTTRPGRGVHLLSLIGRCGKCGGFISARFRREGWPEYTCHKRSCIRIGKADVDLLAERALKAFVKRDDVYARFASRAGNTDALKAVREEIADLNAEHRALGDQVGRGEISATLAARAEPGILARLEKAQARERELTTPAELAGIFKPGQDVDAWWADAPVSTRRTVARFLLGPDWLGYLVIVPAPSPGHRTAAADRVEFRKAWDPDSVPAPPKRRPSLTHSQKAAKAAKEAAATETAPKPRRGRKAP